MDSVTIYTNVSANQSMFDENTQLKNPIDPQQHQSSSDIYISYNQLPNFYEKCQDFEAVIKSIVAHSDEKHDWKVHFDVLDSLRILNKYNTKYAFECLEPCTGFMVSCLNSLRSNLMKNALICNKELFDKLDSQPVPLEYLHKVVPTLLERGISDKHFIKTEAKSCLKVLEKKGCNEEVIQILSERSFDKNFQICELAFHTFCEILNQGRNNLKSKIGDEVLLTVFETLAKGIDGKRAVMKKDAETCCAKLKDVFGGNNALFEQFLQIEIKLKDTYTNLIVNSLKDKKKPSMKSGFHDFIKEQKQQQSKENENSNFMVISTNDK